ncbi:protein unc-79 homolog isoform X4 [Lineus longissimus]|uniref:protein unc-79 homolog isoform X4 n=1 Tax=Lineus longissimus TaxID=88925 RepID=UPI00315CE79F
MATRAATFNAKLRNLKDYLYRSSNNITPLPSGVDVANTLKYFSQTLLSVLKDVPSIPDESYGPRQRDSIRLSVFPNLNYSGLHACVIGIIDVVPVLQYGQTALGEAVLCVLGCLVPFLEYDLLDSLPYIVASTLATFPQSLHSDTVELLCSNLLPMTLGYAEVNDTPTYASESVAAIIMMVFQYVENREYHSRLVECLMSLKMDVAKDLLMVIAYGPPQSRAPAANLLFHYWPQLNQALCDKTGRHYKYLGFEFTAWKPLTCQRENCTNAGNSVAIKMCLDPSLAIEAADKPPPLYICGSCVDVLRRSHAEHLVDVLLPMDHVSLVCENKNCTTKDNIAMCTCFHIECASFNGNRPIRFCENCHKARHANKKHVVQVTVPCVWQCDPELQCYLVEAIVRLLKEAQPMETKRVVEMGEEVTQQHLEDEDEEENEDDEEQKLLSRYGVWLLVELCPPSQEVPVEILGRLIAMLFQWFDATAYLPDDNIGNALERLKPNYVCTWLKEIAKSYFEVILSCLLPHPVEYARVGGHWDTLSSRTSQIKEGLNRLFCLIPYDIITFEVWDYVMPYWLEAIRTEVSEDELSELKVILCKGFDIDMCPLPFSVDRMYGFVTDRFDETTASVQEQALLWMQILSSLEIIIPLHLLVHMFQSGVQSLIDAKLEQQAAVHATLSPGAPPDEMQPPLTPGDQPSPSFTTNEVNKESELNLQCFVYMLDLIFKQAELQDAPRHQSIFHEMSKEIMSLITKMVHAPWDGTHTCTDVVSTNCVMCHKCALWHQLCCQAVEFITPRDAVRLPEKELPKVEEIPKVHSQHHPIPPADDQDEGPSFELNQLPVHLQLIYALLQELCREKDHQAIYYLLKTLKLLCLHAECLNYAAKDTEEFVKYSLKKMLLPNLWKLLQADLSHIASVNVPLMLHCLTLPSGADIFWGLTEHDFTNDDWRLRFAAVEKVTILARLMELKAIKSNQPILTSLAHAFCYLIGSLDDMKSAVAQRTILYLETIKETSLKCLCVCLEFQFDSVMNDRCMILQRMHQLHKLIKDKQVLTWEFFLNRFDTLSLEAQLDLESTGDIPYATDLTSSARDSEHFIRKLNRARFALARTDSVRSVSESFLAKPPYRRACSVPLHLVAKTAINPAMKEKEKAYIRQQSAPQFNLGRRRQSSFKFGMGMFGNYGFPGKRDVNSNKQQKGGQLREFTDEESNFAALLQRAMDLEGVDRDTVHQLSALLMKFMACERTSMTDDRHSVKAQSIVLRHLNVLLGYNQTEKAFSVPPFKLRCSTVFNAFLSGLPQVLDNNFTLGNTILPLCLSLLAYSPSPQRYATDYQPPNYTLWFLEPHTRLTWLLTFLTVLYKYQYNTAALSGIVTILVRIILNTIDAQHHRCRRHDDTFGPASPVIPRNRGRDTSNVSVGDLEQIQETETPPQSPTDSQQSSGDAVTISVTSPAKSTVHYTKLRSESDGRTDETASDLDSSPPTVKILSPKKKVTRRTPRQLPDYSFHQEESQSQTSEESGKKGDDSPKKLNTDETALIKMESPGSAPETPQPDSVWKLQNDVEKEFGDVSDVEDKPGSPVKLTLERSFERHLMEKALKDLNQSSRQYAASDGPQSQQKKVVTPKVSGEFVVEPIRPGEFNTDDMPLSPNRPPDSPIFRTVPKGGDISNGIHHAAERVNPAAPKIIIRQQSSKDGPAPDVDYKMVQQIQEFESQNDRKRVDTSPETTRAETKTIDSSGDSYTTCQTTAQDVTMKDTTNDGAVSTSGTTGTSDQTYSTVSDSLSVTSERRELLKPLIDPAAQAESECEDSPNASPLLKPNFRQRKSRKTGLTTVELQKIIPELADSKHHDQPKSGKEKKQRRPRKADLIKSQQSSSSTSVKKPNPRYAENVIVERCPECHAVLEQYDEDIISLCIICLATFIHREPGLAAPYLLDMLQSVATIAASNPYSWQYDCNNLIVPGNSVSVARQFLRCTLHQLAPNGIFPQLFQSRIDEPDFMKTMASALVDFPELNCYSPLQFILEVCSSDSDTEGVNSKKSLPSENIMLLLENLAAYMDCLTLETPNTLWPNILAHFDAFFRKLPAVLPNPCDMAAVIKIMISVFKIPGLSQFKGILEPFSKLISFMLQNCSFKLQSLIDLCSLCNRAFSKDRDKLLLSRSVIFELVGALKFKTVLPDENLLMLVQFVVIDAGGTIGPTNIVEGLNTCFNPQTHSLLSTSASECMRQHLSDCVEFIADLHTINKVKSNMKGGAQNLNEDTLGSHLKSAISQFTALEFTRSNGRDNRAISRYLPWLYHPPSAMQQGPKEFIDCVGHIRLLSWILIGSLTHTAVTHSTGSIQCQPIPLEASTHISEHIMVIMTGFAEQSKASVLHMSSLFHAFILCQLWTMYCETAANHNPHSEASSAALYTVMDFWGRVTPGVLQLLSHSKVDKPVLELAEMVNLHFLSLMEALQECNSTVLTKLFALWTPVLFTYHAQLPGHLQVRLQTCQNWEPPKQTKDDSGSEANVLMKWLKRLQFKLGQIEVQSSAATQFYTV